MTNDNDSERRRLAELRRGDDINSWRRWGPYVCDRSWGTVREDYGPDGSAWQFLTHDAARGTAYRWGEDAIAGLCDRFQLIVLAPAFWNRRDPILKERLFGLIPDEGNHGEDVKEYYFHLDNLPSHAYMKFLYKYPQREFPYRHLIEENRRRGGQGWEFELLDTGAFDGNQYWDITVEYAKVSTEDLVMRITAVNRGPEPAPLDILPQLWFRNTWAWRRFPGPAPAIRLGERGQGFVRLIADDTEAEPISGLPIDYRLGPRSLYAQTGGLPLFTDNETNPAFAPRVLPPGHRPHYKDAFHRSVIDDDASAVSPEPWGSKAALRYRFDAVPPGQAATVRLRLSDRNDLVDPLAAVDTTIDLRRAEADTFYASIHPPVISDDEKLVQRQAFAGLLWTKQIYLFDVDVWIDGDNPDAPPPASRRKVRNHHWRHLNSMRVMTVPDKWEYPWFAAWDLAFHCVPFALIDPEYAKDQLRLLLFEQFQHPNGQIPAYEWEFSDLNPPVHAWAVWRVYNMDRIRSGQADREFLERCFHKLLINFTWWINRVDRRDNNIFEGGFLGLDNITVVDRSERCEDGSVLEQSDATGWMGMFCLVMMRIALELAKEDRVYEGLATKFFQHYVYVAAAMKHMGGRDYQLWDEEDGFFYDVLSYPDGRFRKFRVRSLVGLIPLFAVERLEEAWIEPFREFRANMDWFMKNRRTLVKNVVHILDHDGETTHALTIVDEDQLARLLVRLWDETEFLAPHGIRSLSRAHLAEPFRYDSHSVGYEPAEAVSKLKGGNSNWRGPIWFPTCFLLIESLRKLAKAYGSDFTIRVPARGGEPITFSEMAQEIADRLIRIFTRDETTNRRPVYGGTSVFQNDPHWRDLILFYEYFQGDDGAGLGASHQTGWTALVANLIDEWRG